MGGIAIVLERFEHARRAGVLCFRERCNAAAEALEEDVSVAYVAEDRREPAELVTHVATANVGSTSERNVRRSERSRRVATRAWCTPSGSTSRRTTGSCRIKRMTESAIARRTTSPADASLPRSETGTSGVSGACAASARMYFAVCSGEPAPACRRRSTSGIEERRRHLVADLHLELAEARRRAPVVEHGHRVVDDPADEPSARVVQAGPPADRRHAHAARGAPRSRTNPRTSSTAASGGLPPFPSKTISGRTRKGASRSAGSFTVQPSPGRCRRLAPQRASRRSSVS